MGQSKSSYQKVPTMSPEQQTLLNQILQQAMPFTQQAAQGYAQFLPGGGGGEAISKAAHQRFQQETVPSILNQFGSGSKSSSALNQALAAGASNLNTDIASQLAQMQLQAASGLGGLAQGLTGQGLGAQPFALAPRGQPFWQQALLGGLGAGGQLGGAFLGR